jgi:hypothetical protein
LCLCLIAMRRQTTYYQYSTHTMYQILQFITWTTWPATASSHCHYTGCYISTCMHIFMLLSIFQSGRNIQRECYPPANNFSNPSDTCLGFLFQLNATMDITPLFNIYDYCVGGGSAVEVSSASSTPTLPVFPTSPGRYHCGKV